MKKKLPVVRSKPTPIGLNLLKDTRCYLCGGMQYAADGRGWRDHIKDQLCNSNITFLDPYYKPFIHDVPEDDNSRAEMLHWMETEQYDLVQQRMWDVRGMDLRCIDLSDFIIAYINPKEPTIGTVEEIITAIREKKVIFLVVKGGKKETPLWYMGVIPHKYIYNSLDEVISTIKAIDDGVIKMSSDRFKLLKPEFR